MRFSGSCAKVGLILSSLLVSHWVNAQVNITTHHYDNARTGANLNETILTPANVNSSQFGKLYSVAVDGQVYAQPLYVSNLAIPNVGSRNVVFVATMNNTVYALDADHNGQTLWKRSFGTPVHPCDVEWHQNVTQGSSIGILGTPVIDLTSRTIYFVSRNEANFDPTKCNWNSSAQSTGVNQGTFTQFLNALDLTTGTPKSGSPMAISASYSSADGMLTFNPQTQNQRTALTLANGEVYVAYASHDDLADYHGWILAFNATTLKQDHVYVDTTTAGAKGGIWQAGEGLTVDGSGNLYVSTGNGGFGTSAGGVTQTGNSFVKLSASLTLLDWFTPSNSATLNSQDADLGASGVLLIPGSSVVTGGGKQGRLYVVPTTNMTHFNAAGDQVQFFQAVMGHGTAHIHGTPIYFDSNSAGPIVYLWGENDFARAFVYNPANQSISGTPLAMSTMTAPETNNVSAMPGGFLSISASGNTNGILWAATPFAADASQATVQGVLHAFDAVTLRELWNDKQNDARDEIGNFAKFVPPIVANGKMIVPNFGPRGAKDGSGSLNVYGLISGGTAPVTLIQDGNYTIVSRYSGLAIDDPALSKASGTVMQQWTPNGGANQVWTVKNVSPNVVSLINNSSSLALGVVDDSTANSALVAQSAYSGDPSQQWNVAAVDGGFFELTNVRSGQALDVDGGTKTAGTQIDQYPYKAVAWQQWSFQAHS